MKQLQNFISAYRYHLGIALILLLAAFMRFYQLPSLPPGLHADEAANGLDALRILQQFDFRPFYDANGGREGLFMYLQALGVQLFGATVLGLRVVPALIGVLAVAAIYAWLSNWFDRRVALIACLIVAVSPWAVTVSRNGFRAGMMALMVPLTLWLYSKAVQTQRLPWYLGAGACLGLGFYTYPAFWIMPVLLGLLAAYLYVRNRPLIQQSLPGAAKSLSAAILIVIPLAWYGFQNAGALLGRPAGVSIFYHPDGMIGAVQALGAGIGKTLLMFHIHGDDNYRHNLGGQPELNIFVGAMFILGFMICAVRMKRLRHLALLTVFILMLVPAMFTAEGLPHALRAYGALPAAAALAALGTLYMLDHWRGIFPMNGAARMLGSAAIAVLLLLTVYQGYTQYFVAWANSPQTYEAYREDTASLAGYYNTRPFSGQRYLVAEAYEAQPVAFLTHGKASYKRLDVAKIDALPLDPEKAKEFAVLSKNSAEAVKRLERKFPTLKRSPHYSRFDDRELYVIYSVPAS